MVTTYFVAEDITTGRRYIAVVYEDGETRGDGELDVEDPAVPESLRDAKPGAYLSEEAE